MGLKGVLNFFFHRLIEFVLLVLLILYLPNLPPYSSFKDSYRLPPNKPFEGKLALNERLNNVEIWHKGDFVGPECFADFNGELYASLYGGDIVKLTGQHITPIVRTGKPCRGAFEENICGRPLGMQFDKQGTLYVADAYYGIMKVNIKTGRKEVLVAPDQEIGGKKPKIFNSLALASNGDIYWSDSSTQFSLQDGIFDLLSDPSGRLIHYDSKARTNTVLIDKLAFANGVVLSENEDLVLVAETARQRIHRYYLKGPKKGTHDIFIEGLPGLTDNLSHDGHGGYFAPLIFGVDEEHPSIYKMLSPFPLIRKFVARVFGLIELAFETIDRAFPNDFSKRAVHTIGHFQLAYLIPPAPTSTLIHLSNNGEIIDSLHNRNKRISSICEAHIFKGVLYLGSPFNDYIARAPLADIGLGHLVKAAPKKPEVTKTTPKTTPSPSKKETVAPPRKDSGTPAPPKVTTSSPPKVTTPSPQNQQTPQVKKETTTPPPAKKETTTPPHAKKEATTPPPSKKETTTPPPVKNQTTTPPPAKKEATTPPPAKKQTTTPPPTKKEATTPPPIKKETTIPPSSKRETTVNEPKVTTASPSPKQQATPQKQTTPPPRQQNQLPHEKPSVHQRESAPKEKNNPSSAQNSGQAPPSSKQQREQIKSVPVKESIKTK